MKRDALALTVALLFPTGMAWLYFVVLSQEGEEPNPAVSTAYGLGKALQVVYAFVYVYLRQRDRLHLGRPTARGLALGVGFAVVIGAAMLGLYYGWLRHSPLTQRTPEMLRHRLQQFGLASPAGFLLIAIFICIFNSVLEEYYWRWFLFGGLRRYLPTAAAVAVSGVGFALHHSVVLGVYFPGRFWQAAFPLTACVAVGGMFWAWLYARSDSILAPWLSHFLLDAAIMVVGYAMLWG